VLFGYTNTSLYVNNQKNDKIEMQYKKLWAKRLAIAEQIGAILGAGVAFVLNEFKIL